MIRPTCALVAALALSAPPQRSAIDDIDALMRDEMRATRIPGAAIAVVENGRIVLARAYGVANLETDTPVETSSVFELASVTKPFTATAIMMLVEEGKVRLDDRLSDYVNRTPPAWERITIRHLLTHTSGLASLALPRIQGSVPLNVSTAQAFEFIAQLPMQFPTGQAGWYSDAGYFLLGMVIEKASGQTYRDFLARRIFGPLHMDSSSVTDRARVIKRRVATYSLRNGQYVNWRRDWDYELPSFFGIWSTLDDLAKWDAALRQATIVTRSTLGRMWTPAVLDDGQRARVLDQLYGFGWELANARGRPTVGHEGASGTYVLRFVDEPFTIVVLTNLDVQSGRRHPRALAYAVAGVVRPQYRPPHLLEAHEDPHPTVTAAVQSLLADIGQRRPSTVMSGAYRSWYGASPGARAWMATQLGGAGTLEYLADDDLGGRALWGGEGLARLIHYATDVNGATKYVTVGMTVDGKAATLDYYSR